ncbi:hypothetical protein [Billgrantia saliphila]|uniref:hypothetical protein n=1 Tax=Billgrantia saliphila TaxID=1848458 RepID=UPI001E63F975|nr:hypothetical protein [Halomonas saliphila]
MKVGDDLWAALHGDTEVMSLTAELIESTPDLFRNVCSCERPRLVARALEKVDRKGLVRVSDRRTYAYLQLSQGEDAWQSEEIQSLLQQAFSSETTLLELLEVMYGEPDACQLGHEPFLSPNSDLATGRGSRDVCGYCGVANLLS